MWNIKSLADPSLDLLFSILFQRDKLPRRALIVDDEKIIANMVKKYIERSKMFEQIDIAYSLSEALKLCKENIYGLSIVDQNLYDVSSLPILEKLATQKLRPITCLISGNLSDPRVTELENKALITHKIQKGGDIADGINEIVEEIFGPI